MLNDGVKSISKIAYFFFLIAYFSMSFDVGFFFCFVLKKMKNTKDANTPTAGTTSYLA